MQPGGPAPLPRGGSSGGMHNIPTQGSSNRVPGMNSNPNLTVPNHQPSERRLSGGMGGNAKFVPPRQAPPTPPQPGPNAGVPQPMNRGLPTPGGAKRVPQTPPPQGTLGADPLICQKSQRYLISANNEQVSLFNVGI